MFNDTTSLHQIPLHLLETHYTNYFPLVASGTESLAQLCWMRECDLLRVPGMGRARVARVQEALSKLGLSLRREI